MTETYSDEAEPEFPEVGTPGDCDRCRDEESGESTGIYDQGTPYGLGEDYTVCPCGTEPDEE